MLGKRKEKLIRDIAADMIATIEGIVERIARPRRGTLEREEIERIAASVIEAIKADLPSDESVDPEPLYPKFYKLFGTPETGHGRLIIEPDGGDNRFTLTAYLPEGMLLSPLHIFKRGTRDDCIASWAKALEWMEKRFPDPVGSESVEPSDPVEPEPVEPEPLVDPRFDKRFGDYVTGVIGRLRIERNGPKNTQFRLIAYLGSGTEDFHVFKRGIMVECEAAWLEACEWMTEKFPENKA